MTQSCLTLRCDPGDQWTGTESTQQCYPDGGGRHSNTNTNITSHTALSTLHPAQASKNWRYFSVFGRISQKTGERTEHHVVIIPVRWALLSGQWGELSTPTTGSSRSSTSDDLYQTQSLTSPVLHVRRKLLSVQCPSALNFSSLKEVVDDLRAVKILEFCFDNNYDGKDKVEK